MKRIRQDTLRLGLRERDTERKKKREIDIQRERERDTERYIQREIQRDRERQVL